MKWVDINQVSQDVKTSCNAVYDMPCTTYRHQLLVFRLQQCFLQPYAVQGAREPMLFSGRQESKQRTNLFTCARDFIPCARLWKKTFSGLLWQEATKTVFSNKDNSCSFTYSLLWVFISQYRIRSILSRWVKLKWGQSQIWRSPLLPPPPPWSHHSTAACWLCLVCGFVFHD